MGLGIAFSGKPRLFQPIRGGALDAALAAVSKRLELPGCERQAGGYLVRICPAGNFFLRFEKGMISGEISTTVAGPGYHKACVELLNELGGELGIGMDIKDATGYVSHKEFKVLKKIMLDWLHQLFVQALRSDPNGECASKYVCWDVSSFRPECGSEFVTPCGLLDPALVTYYIDNKQIEQLANLFWVWCNETKDAYYHRGCALATMWNDVVWRKPITNHDRKTIIRAIGSLSQASRLDPYIKLPTAEWKELCTLVDMEMSPIGNPQLVYPDMIGYRRKTVEYCFAPGYSVYLPGSFVRDDFYEYSANLRDGSRAFGFAVRNADPKKVPDLRAATANESITFFESPRRQLEFVKDDCRYFAQIGDDPGSRQSVLFGHIIGKHRMACISICWEGADDDEWAAEMFQAIRASSGEAKEGCDRLTLR